MAQSHAPSGFNSVSAYLVLEDPQQTITFLETALDATVKECIRGPDDAVQHAEIVIGDSMVMMGGAKGDWSPMPTMLYVYVEDVDKSHARAVAAGAESVNEPTDQFYGDRSSMLRGPQGNLWCLATHQKTISPEEIQRLNDERNVAESS